MADRSKILELPPEHDLCDECGSVVWYGDMAECWFCRAFLCPDCHYQTELWWACARHRDIHPDPELWVRWAWDWLCRFWWRFPLFRPYHMVSLFLRIVYRDAWGGGPLKPREAWDVARGIHRYEPPEVQP